MTPRETTKHAALYLRVSTDDQATNGVSLDMQEQRLHDYCRLRDLTVVAVLREEGVSAGKQLELRPKGQELLRLIESKQVQHVVALKVDRLWRDAEDGLGTLKVWNRQQVGLHIADMGGQAVDTSKAAGWYFFFQMLGFAEFERRQISERTTAGLRHNKQLGKQYHNKPIYGYDLVGGQLVPNREEQLVIKTMQRLRRKGLSLNKIAERLTKDGAPTKRGGRKWYASTIRGILANDLHEPNGDQV